MQNSNERAAAPVVGELPPLPPAPKAVYQHAQLGELFDRFALHQYAVNYADLARAAVAAAKVPTDALPPVICIARPFPTTDKATIHFARDVTDAELLVVNRVLNAKLNNPHYSAGAPVASQAAPVVGELPSIDTPEFRMLEADFVKASIELSPKDHHADNADLYAARTSLVAHVDGKIRAAVAAAKVPTGELPPLPTARRVVDVIDEFGTDATCHIDSDMLAYGELCRAAAPVEQGQGAAPHTIQELLAIYDKEGGDWCKIARAVEERYLAALAPAVAAADQVRDAARFRWLVQQFGGSLSIDLDCGRNEIDETIDDAIQSSNPEGEQQ